MAQEYTRMSSYFDFDFNTTLLEPANRATTRRYSRTTKQFPYRVTAAKTIDGPYSLSHSGEEQSDISITTCHRNLQALTATPDGCIRLRPRLGSSVASQTASSTTTRHTYILLSFHWWNPQNRNRVWFTSSLRADWCSTQRLVGLQ